MFALSFSPCSDVNNRHTVPLIILYYCACVSLCVFLRLWHVYIYQTLQPLSQRESLRLQTDVFRLWSSQERVLVFISHGTALLLWLFQHYYWFSFYCWIFCLLIYLRLDPACVLLALHIHQSDIRPTEVVFVSGMNLVTSSVASSQVYAATGVYWVQRWTQSGALLMLPGWTALFSWQTQGPSRRWKYRRRLQNGDQTQWWMLHVWQVHA